MTTIVLADDHKVVRQGIKSLLGAEPEFCVVGEAGDGLEAVKMVEDLEPDTLVVDIMMRGINGLEVTRQVSKRCPGTSIVVLSMHDEESYVLEALRNGAKAYVLKDSTTEDLVQAIRNVAAGHRYLSSSLSERAIEVYARKGQPDVVDKYDSLTTREREVLQLVARGHTCSDIAEKLFISPRTAEGHRTNLMRKLDVHTQTQLIRYAVQRGIIEEE